MRFGAAVRLKAPGPEVQRYVAEWPVTYDTSCQIHTMGGGYPWRSQATAKALVLPCRFGADNPMLAAIFAFRVLF